MARGIILESSVKSIESVASTLEQHGEFYPITRRSFTWRAAAAALSVIAGGVALSAAGCSGGRQGSNGEGASAGGAGAGAQGGPASTNAAAQSVTGSASELVIAMPPTSEPSAGFDPFVSWGCGEHVHEPLIQSTLITTNAQMSFENDLATSYKCSDDGLTWTFTIRNDAKFTNGAPVTAHDVAFTINGIKNSASAECDLTYVSHATALNDAMCEITLNKPFNAMLYTLATVGIVPADAHGADYGKNPVGSGRYMLEQWDAGQQVILAANPNYYGAAPEISRVIVLFMEEAPALAAAQAKQVDVAYTTATYANQTVRGYDLQSFTSADSRGVSLPCNAAGATKQYRGRDYACGNNVTCNVAIRRAINLATDRQQMIDQVIAGHGQVAYSVCANMPWDSADMQCEFDAEEARRVLDAAGWVAGGSSDVAGGGDASAGNSVGTSGSGADPNVIREKDGVRASFDLYYAASDSTRQAMANVFANQMRGVGIEVNIKGRSWNEIYEHQFSDAVLWGWGTNSPVEAYNIMYSGGVCNYSSYENATVDAHLNDALARANIADSYADYKLAMWDGNAENATASNESGTGGATSANGVGDSGANGASAKGAGVAPKGAATWVWFANVDHLYFTAEGLNIAQQKPHPHGHGWSLLNNVDKWHW